MVGLADGLLAAQQAEQAFGKISVPGQYPQGGAIARDDDLPAFFDPVDDGIGMLPASHAQRDLRWPVGQGWADDGYRETAPAMLLQQTFFAGDLIA